MGAVPERLLVHSCVLRRKSGMDRNRNPVLVGTVLRNVRIGASFQLVRGNVGETRGDAMTLIIDAENTKFMTEAGEAAAAVIPREGDAVEWLGRSFSVRGVTPCFSRGAEPHHWEVTLE